MLVKIYDSQELTATDKTLDNINKNIAVLVEMDVSKEHGTLLSKLLEVRDDIIKKQNNKDTSKTRQIT